MNRMASGIFLALTAFGVFRIVIGYSEISQTIDEAVHVAAGVEWLEQHSYRLHPENPPLARVAVGLLPYLDGAQSVAAYDEANETLGSGPGYLRRLHLARAGTLPAFVLLVALLYAWSRSLLGPSVALGSVALITTLPAILAHAGLATTDLAATTATLFAVLTLARWLAEPSSRNALWLGCGLAAAALVKFSVLLFVAASALGIVAARAWLASSRSGRSGRSSEVRSDGGGASRARQLGLAVGIAATLIWIGYWGSAGPVDLAKAEIHTTLDAALPPAHFGHAALRGLLETSLPAPEFFFGLVQAALHGLEGHSAYLLGEIRKNGWWYFFPVAIAVKTPLPFLALALAGAVGLIQRARQQQQWSYLVPVIAPLAILVSVIPSSLNIGLRHVLAVFPFLAVCGGVALAGLWNAPRHQTLARSLVGVLLLWQLASSLAAHPNYLAYFNPIASSHPEDFLIDSDLDWGQDLHRLRDELESRGIEDASLALFTTADLKNLGLDRFHTLQPGERRRGWIAASIFSIRRQPGFAWLEAFDPVALVGRSIRLYHIDPATPGR